jgi:hypothetical protein
MPVIYMIQNNMTKMCYVGQTTQAFTLRWYQHFFQGGKTKFHQAIKESSVMDWTFRIVEIVEIDKEKYKKSEEVTKYITEREQFYIKHFDCINNGYNSRL